jgi:hypothetical protein
MCQDRERETRANSTGRETNIGMEEPVIYRHDRFLKRQVTRMSKVAN